MINKNLASNIEEFYSINGRVSGLVMKIYKWCKPTHLHPKMMTSQLKASMKAWESVMGKVKTQHIVMGVNAKVGRKQPENKAVGNTA